MRCANCKQELNKNLGDIAYMDWLKLMNYFSHELEENEITEATYNSMTDALMTFKPMEVSHDK